MRDEGEMGSVRQRETEHCPHPDHDHDHEYTVPDMVPDMVPALSRNG